MHPAPSDGPTQAQRAGPPRADLDTTSRDFPDQCGPGCPGPRPALLNSRMTRAASSRQGKNGEIRSGRQAGCRSLRPDDRLRLGPRPVTSTSPQTIPTLLGSTPPRSRQGREGICTKGSVTPVDHRVVRHTLARFGVIDRSSERRMRLLGQIAHTWTNAHNRALVFVRLISLPHVGAPGRRPRPALLDVASPREVRPAAICPQFIGVHRRTTCILTCPRARNQSSY